MEYRELGATGIRISVISFGCGPVPALLTGDDEESQSALVQHAIDSGINWFDTAATYGEGRSERALGRALDAAAAGPEIHVATKVRLDTTDPAPLGDQVIRSVEDSLTRLGREHVTLLQLHNSVTPARGDEATSITPNDILGPRGVLDAFEALRCRGTVRHLGLTGIGDPTSLRDVIRSGAFATIQTPYHLFNPSAGQPMPASFAETDFGDLLATCTARRVGFLAIRVYAGGALAGCAPSAHTHTTRFFPLDLFRRDQKRVLRLLELVGGDIARVRDLALRFVVGTPGVASAILGLGASDHVDQAIRATESGKLSREEQRCLQTIWEEAP